MSVRFGFAMAVVNLESFCVCEIDIGGRKGKGKDSKEVSRAPCAVAPTPCQGRVKRKRAFCKHKDSDVLNIQFCQGKPFTPSEHG